MIKLITNWKFTVLVEIDLKKKKKLKKIECFAFYLTNKFPISDTTSEYFKVIRSPVF